MNGQSFPWVYPYLSGPVDAAYGLVMRPVVGVAVEDATRRQFGLVDSGSEHTILSPDIAHDLGLARDASSAFLLGLGGGVQTVHPVEVELRLLPPAHVDAEPVRW